MRKTRTNAKPGKLDPMVLERGERLRESSRLTNSLGHKIIGELREVMGHGELSPIGAEERLFVLQGLFREFATTLQDRAEHYMHLVALQGSKLPYHN